MQKCRTWQEEQFHPVSHESRFRLRRFQDRLASHDLVQVSLVSDEMKGPDNDATKK
jgi:hypothetical protein